MFGPNDNFDIKSSHFIPGLIKKIALPASVGTFFQTMYNIVDTFFAGKISPEALSALAKSFPLYFLIISAGIGIVAGATFYNFRRDKKIFLY